MTEKSPEGCHSRNKGEEGLAPPGVGSERKGDQEATSEAGAVVCSPSEDASFLIPLFPPILGRVRKLASLLINYKLHI